jgi:hypothetical protein
LSKFKVTYFAPYTFAKFDCEAPTAACAIVEWMLFNEENGYDIPNREIKSLTFNGKKISTNGQFI